MYKLQFCNADTQEVLRETECDHLDHIFGLVKLAKKVWNLTLTFLTVNKDCMLQIIILIQLFMTNVIRFSESFLK
jgi:hypothetical protein